MLRTIFFFLYSFIAAIILLPAAFIANLLPHRRAEGKVPGFVQFAADVFVPPILWICGVNIKRSGEKNLPKGESALFVGNHQGMFDAAIAVNSLGPVMSIIMKKENGKIPGASLLLGYFDCIFLDRENVRASLKDMEKAQKMLENGRSVLVFPEGTRSRGPQLGSFKPGALRCAVRAGVPIVPFVIDGSYRAFEKDGRLSPADIRLSILPPIGPEEYENMNTTQLSDEIRNKIQNELNKMRGEDNA